jgi:hypothetical protein
VWLVGYRPALTASTWAIVALTVLATFRVIDGTATIAVLAMGVTVNGGQPLELPGMAQYALFPVALMGTLTNVVQPVVVPAFLSWWSFRCRVIAGTMPVGPFRWSPGWAACGWFVPIANLFVPFLVIRELWSTSGPMRDRWIVAAWWAVWIADLLFFWLSGSVVRAVHTDRPIVIAGVLLGVPLALGSGVAGIVVVHRLTGLLEARRRALVPVGAPDTPPEEPLSRWAGSYAPLALLSSFAIAAVVVAAATSLAMFLVGAVTLFVLGERLADVSVQLFALWAIALALYVIAGLVVAPALTAICARAVVGRSYVMRPSHSCPGCSQASVWASQPRAGASSRGRNASRSASSLGRLYLALSSSTISGRR